MVGPVRMVVVAARAQTELVDKVVAWGCRWVLVLEVLPSVGLIVAGRW